MVCTIYINHFFATVCYKYVIIGIRLNITFILSRKFLYLIYKKTQKFIYLMYKKTQKFLYLVYKKTRKSYVILINQFNFDCYKYFELLYLYQNVSRSFSYLAVLLFDKTFIYLSWCYSLARILVCLYCECICTTV